VLKDASTYIVAAVRRFKKEFDACLSKGTA